MPSDLYEISILELRRCTINYRGFILAGAALLHGNTSHAVLPIY